MLEIVEGSKHSVIQIARAMSQDHLSLDAAIGKIPLPGGGKAAAEVAADSGGGEASEVGDGEEGVVSEEEEEEEQEQDTAAKRVCNATARRRGAFRRGLIRCVVLVQDAFLKEAGKEGGGGGYDALKEGRWHPGFWAAVPGQGEILAAAGKSAAELNLAEKTGNIRWLVFTRTAWGRVLRVSAIQLCAPLCLNLPCHTCTYLAPELIAHGKRAEMTFSTDAVQGAWRILWAGHAGFLEGPC